MKTRAVLLCLAITLFSAASIFSEDLRVWPLYYSNTDTASGETRQEVFWPLYSRYASKTISVHKILSFQNEYPEQFPSQQYFLWPLSGFRWGEELHDLWIFPLLWSASDKNRGHFSLFPLWAYWWRPEHRHLNIALLQYNHWHGDGQAHYLLPLLWSSWRDSQHSREFSHGAFPLFRVALRQDSPAKGVASGNRYASFYLFPFWQGSQGRDATPGGTAYLSQWQAILPLFYNAKEKKISEKRHDCTPVLWQKNVFWLFPYWQERRSHKATDSPPSTRAELKALATDDFQLDDCRRLLLPFYWQRKHLDYDKSNRECIGESEQFWLFPWWMSYQKGALGESCSHWLFPAQWGESTEKDKRGMQQEKNWRAFWPLYRARQECELSAAGEKRLDSKSLWLFPWYNSSFEGPQAHGSSWFLLLGGAGKSAQDTESSQAKQGFRYVLPFYFQSWLRQSDGAATLRQEDKLWAFPYWRTRGQDKEQDFLPPLYFSKRQSHRDEFLSLAGIYNQREKQNSQQQKKLRAAEQSCDMYGHWQKKRPREDCFWQHLLPFWFRSFDADKESHAIFPLYHFSEGCDRSYDYRKTLWLPWLLGSTTTVSGADGRQRTAQSYALSLYKRGDNTWMDERQAPKHASSMQIFPLFSYSNVGDDYFYCWSTLPPFSYHRRGSIFAFAENSRSLSVPWGWLPLYRSDFWQDSPIKGKSIRRNRLFPLYSYENNEKTETKRLSILWFLYQREQFRDEKKSWGMGGGLSNYYERDSNGFVERSVLYRLYRSRERSWFSEREIMPFYTGVEYANDDWHWSLLGGLLGAGKSGDSSWMKFFYIPFRSQRTPLSAEQLEAQRLQRAPQHLKYALKYAKAGRFDRAAMEFLLAEGTFESDYDLLLAAGNAYAKADAERFAEYFRKDLPSSLSCLAGQGEKYRRGRAKQNLQRQALEFYQQALQLRSSSDLLRRMALCHLQLGEGLLALQKLKERDEQFPSFAAAIDYFRIVDKTRGYRYPKTGELPLHVKLLEEMLERFPEQPVFYMYKAFNIGEANAEKIDFFEKAALACPPAEELMPLPISRELPCKVIHQLGNFPPPAQISASAARHAIQLLNHDYTKKRQKNLLRKEQARQLKERACKLYPLQGHSDWGKLEILEKYHREFGSDSGLRQDLLALRQAVAEDMDKKKLLQALQSSLLEVELRLSQLNTWAVRRIDEGANPEQREVRLFEKASDGYVDLDAFYGGIDNCEIEAECKIFAPAEMSVLLRLGFDRELRVELNGKQLFDPKKQRIARRDRWSLPLTLQPGENSLKFYLRDDRLSFGFYARLTDLAGQPTGSWKWQDKPSTQP